MLTVIKPLPKPTQQKVKTWKFAAKFLWERAFYGR